MWIIADDMTGACDVAAAVGRTAWVPLDGGFEHHNAEVTVRSTETRTLSLDEARAAVSTLLAEVHDPIAYWKIDSLLRGHWAHEIAEAMRLGAVRRILVAPAFPEQGRTTSSGIQYAHGMTVAEYLCGGQSSIWQHLRAAGIPAERFRIVDAETSSELQGAAATLMPGETPVGSAGLARLLWGPRVVCAAPAPGILLAIFGSASARGREQLEAIRSLPRVRVVEPEAADMLLYRVRLACLEYSPAALLVAGGETLAGVARLLEFRGMLVEGEVAPGIALARIEGGPMHSRQIVTKAGDFGDRDTLVTIVRMLG